MAEGNTMTIKEMMDRYSPEPYPYSLPHQPLPCCYFLCSELEVKYVGQTVRLPARLGDHRVSKPPFDQVFFLPVPLRKLTKTESRLIAEIDPPWNGGVGAACGLNLKEICKKYGIQTDSLADGLMLAPHSKRDKMADRIYKLESSLSVIHDLLGRAIQKDRFDLVVNVQSYIGSVLSNMRYSERY